MENNQNIKTLNTALKVERFSNECRKTKTKVIIPANQANTNYPMNQSDLEANTCNWCQARENASEQVAIGLSFTSDWLRKWREIFYPITE